MMVVPDFDTLILLTIQVWTALCVGVILWLVITGTMVVADWFSE